MNTECNLTLYRFCFFFFYIKSTIIDNEIHIVFSDRFRSKHNRNLSIIE